MVPYLLAHGALQNFVGDFGQTALSSLQFFKGSFADASKFRIKDRPQ